MELDLESLIEELVGEETSLDSLSDSHFDEENRILWLEGDVDEGVVNLTKAIIRWNLLDMQSEKPVSTRKPIRIVIDSPGGLLEPAITLHEVIKSSVTPVYTINIGQASSAAALIFSAGHKRAAATGSYFLFHEGEGGAAGTFRQSKQRMAHYEHLVTQMTEAFISNFDLSGKKAKQFRKRMNGDWFIYMTPLMEEETDVKGFNLVTTTYQDLMY